MKKAKEAEKAIFTRKKGVCLSRGNCACPTRFFFFGGGGGGGGLTGHPEFGSKENPIIYHFFSWEESLKLDGMGKMFHEGVGRFWETYFVLPLFW